MNTENDLIQKLLVSKKIMEKHDTIGRGNLPGSSMPMVEDFQPVNAGYNIPQELLSEQPSNTNDFDPTKPVETTRILNSKLPDEIKKLMIEAPIVQPNPISNNVISEDIIEGAQRLMNINKGGVPTSKKVISETKTSLSNTISNTPSIDMKELKSMIRDVVRDTVRDVVREELKDAGMLVESTTNSNDQLQFKVGKHLFIGKVSKVKKLQ